MSDLPWRVTVLGVPASLQAKANRKRRWKLKVKTAAEAQLPPDQQLLTRQVRVEITHFHYGAPLVDVDNQVKPILDALIDLVYDDDSRVKESEARLVNLDETFFTTDLTPHLSRAFDSGEPFVHIKILELSNGEVSL